MKKTLNELINAIDNFQFTGIARGCLAYGNGHINDSFKVYFEEYDGTKTAYLMQAVNRNVFKNAEQVMKNIELVTEHLKGRNKDPRGVLSLVYTKEGKSYYIDGANSFWRAYRFIDDSICIDVPEKTEDFYECGIAFGGFQRDLADFDAEKLYEVIPQFHDTVKRYNDFLKAVEEDRIGRVNDVPEEIKFIKDRADFYSVLADANKAGELPFRVSHNDTKTNNTLLDAKTHKALCVIDLDTIMPGFAVTDFGDSIRFGANTAAEDEKDLSKVQFSLEMFKAYADGFLTGCDGQLLNSEIMLLPEGAKMMTIECGMRFLTDYLQGDTYFKTHYSDHNLVRCRTQLKLVAEMEKNWDKMKEIVAKYCK